MPTPLYSSRNQHHTPEDGKLDLLLDPICTIFAVDCQINRDTLEIGALYLEPLLQDSLVTLSHEAVTLRVELPTELLHRPRPFVAWNYELPIIPR